MAHLGVVHRQDRAKTEWQGLKTVNHHPSFMLAFRVANALDRLKEDGEALKTELKLEPTEDMIICSLKVMHMIPCFF